MEPKAAHPDDWGAVPASWRSWEMRLVRPFPEVMLLPDSDSVTEDLKRLEPQVPGAAAEVPQPSQPCNG